MFEKLSWTTDVTHVTASVKHQPKLLLIKCLFSHKTKKSMYCKAPYNKANITPFAETETFSFAQHTLSSNDSS